MFFVNLQTGSVCIKQQEPCRLPSRQAEFNGTDRLRLDAHSDDQAVMETKAILRAES